MVSATSKGSDQPVHMRSLIRAFARATDRTAFGVSKLKKRLHRLVCVYSCQNITLPGRVAQSVTCLATDACLIADPGVRSRSGPILSGRLIMK